MPRLSNRPRNVAGFPYFAICCKPLLLFPLSSLKKRISSFLYHNVATLHNQQHLRMYLIFHLLFPGTFNHEDSTHAQMLFTLYYKLTNLHCPSKTGSHWELLGFQGSDPSTDFRGVGVLGLIQPLALSLSPTALPFLSEVIEFSRCPTQGFPFMVLSLNVTCIVLNLLREGYLDKLIRDKNSVFDVVNVYYGAVLFYIYNSWRNENLTLVASGELLKRAEQKCKVNVNQCIKQFESYLETYVQADDCEGVKLEQVQLSV